MARLLAAVALVGCAHWTAKDTALEAGFAFATMIDWQQTDTITYDCGELNPIMGLCGQRVPVGVYFPAMLGLHALVSALLPRDWRTVFQAATAGMEGTTAYWNSRTLR